MQWERDGNIFRLECEREGDTLRRSDFRGVFKFCTRSEYVHNKHTEGKNCLFHYYLKINYPLINGPVHDRVGLLLIINNHNYLVVYINKSYVLKINRFHLFQVGLDKGKGESERETQAYGMKYYFIIRSSII